MRNCQFCQTELVESARFCYHCGAKVKEQNIDCSECSTSNRKDAAFCIECGHAFKEQATTRSTEPIIYNSIYPLDFRDLKGMGSEIRKYFIQALDERIKATQDPKKRQDYMNRLMQSDFQPIFELRTNQLAEEAYTIHTKQGKDIPQEVDQLLTKSFDGLLDYFMVKYCGDINEVNIPDEALSYEGANKEELDLQKMVIDFLALESEEVTVYVDFIKMPLRKLQNASRNFLFPAKDEKVLLIADQTIFGTCREGFALTEDAIYWKAHFKDAEKLFYHQIETIKKEKDWLLINDVFFNVNPSVNGKMVFLLNKLKGMS